MQWSCSAYAWLYNCISYPGVCPLIGKTRLSPCGDNHTCMYLCPSRLFHHPLSCRWEGRRLNVGLLYALCLCWAGYRMMRCMLKNKCFVVVTEAWDMRMTPSFFLIHRSSMCPIRTPSRKSTGRQQRWISCIHPFPRLVILFHQPLLCMQYTQPIVNPGGSVGIEITTWMTCNACQGAVVVCRVCIWYDIPGCCSYSVVSHVDGRYL